MAKIGSRLHLLSAAFVVCGLLGHHPVGATELKPDTEAAFDRYIRVTETQMDNDTGSGRFLVVDALPDKLRQQAYQELRRGQLYIQEVETKDDEQSIRVPNGLVHHWAGVMFVAGGTLFEVIAVLQDYDHHKEIYGPEVRNSRLLYHDGNEFRVCEQLYRKSIVTLVINANFDVHYRLLDTARAMSWSHSTRIAEVENVNQPNEHELPVGNDHGYVWRLDSYWRIEQKDGGVYIQVESVALSRSVPAMWAWLVNPLLRSIPRTALANALNATRKAMKPTLSERQ